MEQISTYGKKNCFIKTAVYSKKSLSSTEKNINQVSKYKGIKMVMSKC